MISALILLAVAGQSSGVEVGKPVPDVALLDMGGKSVRLSSFRGKKLVLFNWATW